MPFLEWCITRLLITTLPIWLFWLLLALLLTLFGSKLAREKNLFVPFFKEVQAISAMRHNLPLYKNIANLAVLVLFWPPFFWLFLAPKQPKKQISHSQSLRLCTGVNICPKNPKVFPPEKKVFPKKIIEFQCF